MKKVSNIVEKMVQDLFYYVVSLNRMCDISAFFLNPLALPLSGVLITSAKIQIHEKQ